MLEGARPPDLEQALAALQGARREGGWIHLLDHAAWSDALRALVGCLPGGASVVVLAEPASPSSDPGVYQRLWDRSDDLAPALAAWRSGAADWPLLQPGELVRLA